MELPWEKEFFDYIIIGNELSCIRQPNIVLNKLKKYIKKDRHIIVSAHNVKHYSVILPLILNDEFTYSDSGILDETYSKMYTATELRNLLIESGYNLEIMKYTQRSKPDEEIREKLEKVMSALDINNRETFFAYQYIIKAECN